MLENRIQLSGSAIINDNKELLVLWKIKHQHYEFPGGKVEAGETQEQAALRECREELGVDVDLFEYLGFEKFEIDGKLFESHKFLGKIKDGQKPKVAEPDKFSKLFWLPIAKYEDYVCAPNIKEFCQNVIDGKIKIKN